MAEETPAGGQASGAVPPAVRRFVYQATEPSASTTANRPTVKSVGFMHFDITLGKPIWWNGTVWKDAAGTTV